MGDLVHLPRFLRRGTLKPEGEPATITILPVVRVERQPDDPYIAEMIEPLHVPGCGVVRLTLAERRALGLRWGLDENGNPLAGTSKL